VPSETDKSTLRRSKNSSRVPDTASTSSRCTNRIRNGSQQVSKRSRQGRSTSPGVCQGLFIGLTITLFVLFALLRDGEQLVAWVQWVLPVDEDILDELREGLDQLMWASVVGNVAVAAIQAALLGVGLAIAGLPPP